MKKIHSSIHAGLVRACKIHVIVGLIFAVQIVIYDAGMLVTPDVVLKRWGFTAALIILASICWYLARTKLESRMSHQLVWALITIDLIIGSYYVYSQRGMASRAIILFVLPILTAAILQRKGAIYLTASAAVTTYVVTAIAYFVLNFNEGYKIELYGELGFYSAVLFVIAALSWNLVRTKR